MSNVPTLVMSTIPWWVPSQAMSSKSLMQTLRAMKRFHSKPCQACTTLVEMVQHPRQLHWFSIQKISTQALNTQLIGYFAIGTVMSVIMISVKFLEHQVLYLSPLHHRACIRRQSPLQTLEWTMNI